MESLYHDLRQLAAQKMANERPGHTLTATALVHEAYLRLASGEDPSHWESRGHFYGAAATAMRRILIDRARRKRAARHGGGLALEPLDSAIIASSDSEPPDAILALDEALTRLAEEAPRKARLVELRYFVGLTSAEAADVLDISKPTADRDWAFARAWLYRELNGNPSFSPSQDA